MKTRIVLLLLLAVCLSLGAQEALQINGLNEAQFVYRTVEDSLNTYFKDSFGFNLGYRNFRFGMKFISELPKYSNQSSELMSELDPNRLSVAWKELYAEYQKDAFSIHAGTTQESFGQGITFRSFQDIELDEDHRLDSFLLRYEDQLRFKAIYGALESESYPGRYDLAYGVDAEYPVLGGIRLGASTLAFRNLGAFSKYSFRDVFAGRLLVTQGNFDSYAEYAYSDQYRLQGSSAIQGSAFYLNADYMLGNLLLGAAYKNYEDFGYRLQDIPLANYHGETLSDALASGLDEEGWQTRLMYNFNESLSFTADYAEAWDEAKDKQMNDLFLAVDLYLDQDQYQLSYSHIEKIDEAVNTWQKEYYPAISAGFSLMATPVQVTAEFKEIVKQQNETESSHYEPFVQADFTLHKLSLSLGLQSSWEDFSAWSDSRYMPNIELKYPIFSHSDLLVFAGKEAGGKVCRNGVCRYLAPFEGVRAELSTRF
ncbi:MAG: DUF6029 family protein [Candidatus Cloacimonadaceae bacterium]|jgi:uncharacterized protein YgfB (UPF0149 family)|nr:DUF6029 family protein [Candidatus Cloacimonadota bacterium]MDY0128278.1 DUF6029 family protein [Candidatus Cloacimonadaceae bacterium]MCB5254034.1 DUF6029 family protein [Candidatus Cloacimonadota bacterium]MCK9178588.1 DUF6029 family protein [Candidatus Cloacimonadota bacterium]MCK9243229.1 DUF6029 family protein [Candidatus Cloacimonadota bacterium]